MLLRKIVLVGLTVATISGVLAISPLVVAQQNSANRSGVLVSPSIIEKDVIPGEEVKVEIKLENLTSSDLQLYLGTTDFVNNPDESGVPKFVDAPGPQSLSNWIRFDNDKIVVEANTRQAIEVTIVVPEDAEAGSHFGAVVFTKDSPGNVGNLNVGVNYEVGTLVFAKVAGEILDKGNVVGFETDRTWYDSPPVKFITRYENTGNVVSKPLGLIEIYNIAGVKEGVMQINADFGATLPGSTRKYEVTWNADKWLGFIPRMGRYTAEGLLSYGSPETTTKLGPVTFWLIPINAILFVCLLIFGAIILLWLLLRMYERRIIKKHKGTSGGN